MDITIYSGDLLEGLNATARVLPARPTTPALGAILLETTGTGVRMTGSDGTTSVVWTGDASVLSDGQAMLPGKLLADLARKLPGGNVRLTVDDRSAQVQCGKSRCKLAVVAEGKYPSVTQIKNPYMLTVTNSMLREMIGRAASCVSTDTTRLVLTGALMEVTAGGLCMVSLDGYRMSVNTFACPYILPEGKDSVRAVVPGHVLSEVVRTLGTPEGDCVIAIGEHSISFTVGEIQITGALLAGDFVDYARLMPDIFQTTALVDRSQLMDAVSRAGLLAREGKNNLIRVQLGDNLMRLSSMSEAGDVEEELDVAMDGAPINIAFNAVYLADILKNAGDEHIRLRMNTPFSPCVVTPEDGGAWKLMVLPVRTRPEEGR